MSDIIVTEEKSNVTHVFFGATPRGMVEQATALAEPLCDVIKKQGLYSEIQGRKYVKVEGWQTLGSMLRILPRETKVIEHPDGSFEAYVDLVNFNTGMVVGGGSALCGMDEKRWRTADRYARRSMAITRATGKAYRLCFGWIMTMSGYEPTPAEEMLAEEVYEGKLKQKMVLRDIFSELTIADVSAQQEISQAMIGKPMSQLRDAVAHYVQNPL